MWWKIAVSLVPSDHSRGPSKGKRAVQKEGRNRLEGYRNRPSLAEPGLTVRGVRALLDCEATLAHLRGDSIRQSPYASRFLNQVRGFYL